MVALAPTDDNDITSSSKLSDAEMRLLALRSATIRQRKQQQQQMGLVLQVGAILGLAAIYSHVSELSLSPVYGSIPSSINHQRVVMAIYLLGWAVKPFARRHLSQSAVRIIPVWLFYIPVMQFFLFQKSAFLGARYGPIITEALTYLPMLLLSTTCAARLLEEVDLSGWGQRIADVGPGIGSYVFFRAVEFGSKVILNGTTGAIFPFTRLGSQIVLAVMYAIFSPSLLLLLAIPAVIHTAVFNVHVPLPYQMGVLNDTLAESGYRILARQESVTGYVSVLENVERHFRVMRCDHSLLGGEWLKPSGMEWGNLVGEPIYAVFAMLEAVRLVNVVVHESQEVEMQGKNALVM